MGGLPSHRRTQLCPCVSPIAELNLCAAHRQFVYGKNMSDSSKKGNYSVSHIGTGSVEPFASNRYARQLNVILLMRPQNRHAQPTLAHRTENCWRHDRSMDKTMSSLLKFQVVSKSC